MPMQGLQSLYVIHHIAKNKVEGDDSKVLPCVVMHCPTLSRTFLSILATTRHTWYLLLFYQVLICFYQCSRIFKTHQVLVFQNKVYLYKRGTL
jgi:hypothetical protein